MEAAAADPSTTEPQATAVGGTGSRTLADLLPLAVAQYGEQVALRHKHDGRWLDVTYAEVGEICSEVARGLIDLGVQPGERVCILCGTRPEWSYADFAIAMIGAVKVTV